jgi:hypothetical protein
MLKIASFRGLAVAAGVGCIVLTAAALAADAPKWAGGRTADAATPGPRMVAARMFAEIDANHDGRITRVEADAFMKARAAEIDANHDGKISADELKAFIQKQRDKRLAERLTRMDENGDGTVTVDEFASAGTWRLARLDRDGSGTIELNRTHHRWHPRARPGMAPHN